MSKIKIHLDQKIVTDLSISNEAIAVYLALRSVMKQEQDEYAVTTNQLLFQSTYRSQFTRYEKSCFLTGMNELIEKGIIENRRRISPSEKIMDLSSIWLNKGDGRNFTEIELCEAQKILNDCDTNRYSVLRYFILLVGTFNPNIAVRLPKSESDVTRILSILPIKYLSRISGLSNSTIIAYNKMLEDFKLLYIYHADGYHHISDNIIQSPSNVYSRYNNREYVTQYVKTSSWYQKENDDISSLKISPNHKRRLAQLYNRIISGAGSYTNDEVQEVYEYIKGSNEKYQELYERSKDESLKEKIRDVGKLETILKKGTNT